MKKATIAHLSDIHIRFTTRHQEYRDVFARLYEDLKKQKPTRIVITGDLFHQKVNMSPASIDLGTEFLTSLAAIAPTDIILGNHDVNMQQKNQGDSVSPIINVANKFYELDGKYKKDPKKAFTITEDNKDSVDYTKKGIYFFPNSGFYNINEDIVYGVFSCKDEKILKLENKDENKKYVALYHGGIKGGRGNNGYELYGDNLLTVDTFEGFDVVLLGDYHEFQTFRTDESMAYASSLIQQNYGESINKNYLLWDLATNSFDQKFVLNDCGFSKIVIAKGENIEERIENIQFSNDKKKTEVLIYWEDFEENYSTEKENQIIKLVKDRHNCKNVKVEFVEIKKAKQDNNEVSDSKNQETFIEQIKNYTKEVSPDIKDEFIEELVKFAIYVDNELEISDKNDDIKTWSLDSIEISNIFSFPEEPTKINLEALRGVTGIFGKNYCGKSNVIKSIVWGLYGNILGGGSAKKLVNIYTASNKGYVKENLTIDGEKYYIKREVITKIDKHGESSNSYPIECKKLVIEDGEEKWVDELSDNTANSKMEVKNIVSKAIGTVDDFTKVCLQTQSGKEDYINQEQQPKNDLVNKYLGLEHFRDRYDYANKFFNDVKKKQKELGDLSSAQMLVLNLQDKIKTLENEYNAQLKTKEDSEKEKDVVDAKIIELTKTLKQYTPLLNNEFSNENEVLSNISMLQQQIEREKITLSELEIWVANNFKKELPFDENESIEKLREDYRNEEAEFQKENVKYNETKSWLELNQEKQIFSIEGFDNIIKNFNVEIANLNAKLPTYKGEQCPTCGHVTAQPNIDLYNQCVEEIKGKAAELNNYTNAVNQNRIDLAYNNSRVVKSSELQRLFDSLTARTARKKALTEKGNLMNQSKEIIEHNKNVELKNKSLNDTRISIDNKIKNIEKLNNNLIKIKDIIVCKSHNISIEEEIALLQDQSKGYKLTIFNLSQEIVTKNGDIRVEKSSLLEYTKKMQEIIDAEKEYKKYSLYIQAVHRDGIPAKIIRNKMPIINNKINSILSSIVDFRIEMSVTTKGDIIEGFYFNSNKSDLLPLSFASGAQKFISSVVIKDAMHYMSNLIKPSLNIIDEGFGTLDDDLVAGIVTVIQYLKNKYKNVIIITHRNEIKDSADSIIEVYKSYDNIPQEILDANEHAGMTKINIS